MPRLRENWLLLGLAAAVAAGLAYPEGGAVVRTTPGLLTTLTAASLFFSGLSLDLSELRVADHVRAVALGLAATYVVAPLAALLLGLACGPPGPRTADSESYRFLESMMILGSQAGTIASAPALTLIAGGNQALALVITVASNLLTSLLTPLILELSIGAVVAFPAMDMAGRVAGVVLLPVAGAQVVRRGAGHALRSRLPYAVQASQLVILVVQHSDAPRGSIYYYFPGGKAQLVEEATRHAGDVLAAGLATALDREGGALLALEGLVRFFRSLLERHDFAAGCPVVAAAVQSERLPALRAAAADVFRRWEDLLTTMLQREGLDENGARALATLQFTALEGAIIVARAQRSMAPFDRVADQLRALVRDACASGGRSK